MYSLHRSLSLVLTAAACVLSSAAAAPPARPTAEQIAQWVRQLGDDDFTVREEASKKLYAAGQAAESAVQTATRSDDAEVARRALEIMDKFRWGIYPDTPGKVVDLASRYRAAGANAKGPVIAELLDAGPAGYRVVLKIAAAEQDATVRSAVFTEIARDLPRAAPRMIAEENYDTLELLLDVVLANDAEQGVGHYAAYYLMRGKLDERIAHFKASAAKDPDPKRTWEIVAHLCHAKRDLAGAREAAEKAQKPELVDALLFEAGDWKELAKREVHSESDSLYEQLGFRATYHRLAGDAKGFDDDVAELRKATAVTPNDEYARFHLAKVLLLNDRPADGVDVLANTPDRRAAAFEALAAQMKYKAALELAEKAKAAGAAEAPALEILEARTLYSLGEKEKALPIFARYGDDIKDGADFSWFEGLIDAENRVGLKDQAAEHAARVLCTSRDLGWSRRLFPKLFPKNAEAAETLWAILRQTRPEQAPAAAMARLRGLLDGKADPKDVADLAREGQGGFMPNVPPDQACRALAEAALACKDEVLARALLEKEGSAEGLIRLGDMYAAKKEWDRAADQYSRAWDKDQTRPLALYLNGWALTHVGQEKEGKKRMEQSHWMPLGDGEARFAFLRALGDRGQKEAEQREGELLLRLSVAGSYHAAEGLRQAALNALDGKDYAAAADGQERSMLRCLNSGVNYVQPAAYLGVPAFIHRLRARGYTAQGKIDDARREAGLGLAALPGDTFFPIELIPAWDKAGHKKEATELFEKCLAVQEKTCDDYPNCSWAHNSAAWISVCCRRNLAAAREHALKAAALAPGNAGVLDTLAEVYFQSGEKEKAVATEKKVVELDPKKPYFRKQLQRIEAGDPNAERPLEEDNDD